MRLLLLLSGLINSKSQKPKRQETSALEKQTWRECEEDEDIVFILSSFAALSAKVQHRNRNAATMKTDLNLSAERGAWLRCPGAASSEHPAPPAASFSLAAAWQQLRPAAFRQPHAPPSPPAVMSYVQGYERRCTKTKEAADLETACSSCLHRLLSLQLFRLACLQSEQLRFDFMVLLLQRIQLCLQLSIFLLKMSALCFTFLRFL